MWWLKSQRAFSSKNPFKLGLELFSKRLFNFHLKISRKDLKSGFSSRSHLQTSFKTFFFLLFLSIFLYFLRQRLCESVLYIFFSLMKLKFLECLSTRSFVVVFFLSYSHMHTQSLFLPFKLFLKSPLYNRSK